MPEIVSVKEPVGHFEEPWLVLEIQPDEVPGLAEPVRVKVDFEVDELEDMVHVHDAVDGAGRHVLRELPPRLIKRWEADLSDAIQPVAYADEGTAEGTATGSEPSEQSDSESADKALLTCLSHFANIGLLAKVRGAQPGESRSWGGKSYTKQPDGSWKAGGGGGGGRGGKAEASGERPGHAGKRVATQTPESIDYSEDSPTRAARARHREGQAKAEAQHLDAAEEHRHGLDKRIVIDPIEMLKGKAARAGEVRNWGGKNYKKRTDGGWEEVPVGQKAPGKVKPMEQHELVQPPKERQAKILVGRFIQSRRLGDVAGAKAIMDRLAKVVPHPESRRKALMQFGDPDHPEHGHKAHAAVREYLDGIPTEDMVHVMRHVK